MHRLLTLVVLNASAAGCLAAQTPPASLYFERGDARVGFAASEIRRALAEQGVSLVERGLQDAGKAAEGTRFVIAAGAQQSARLAGELKVAPPASSVPQSYSIRRQGAIYVVLAADAAGAMYGGLDLAEAIRLSTLSELKDAEHTPHIAQRGIKFNIPLDARTPSYSDAGDAAQQNIAEMWSFDFWREFLDEMARDRFNVLSLWNLHPFPSMVKVPEYPDIALNDVMRTTAKLTPCGILCRARQCREPGSSTSGSIARACWAVSRWAALRLHRWRRRSARTHAPLCNWCRSCARRRTKNCA